MTDDATQVLIFLGIIAVFAIIWAIFENLGAVEEGTLEERERYPSLNTNIGTYIGKDLIVLNI